MEYIREIQVTVEIDTNKRTEKRVFMLGEDESTEDFFQRVKGESQELIEN